MRRLYSNEYIQPINKALLMGSPFRSRRKAIVKKPSGRYWDDQRNVWVPDPHKQPKSTKRPKARKVDSADAKKETTDRPVNGRLTPEQRRQAIEHPTNAHMRARTTGSTKPFPDANNDHGHAVNIPDVSLDVERSANWLLADDTFKHALAGKVIENDFEGMLDEGLSRGASMAATFAAVRALYGITLDYRKGQVGKLPKGRLPNWSQTTIHKTWGDEKVLWKHVQSVLGGDAESDEAMEAFRNYLAQGVEQVLTEENLHKRHSATAEEKLRSKIRQAMYAAEMQHRQSAWTAHARDKREQERKEKEKLVGPFVEGKGPKATPTNPAKEIAKKSSGELRLYIEAARDGVITAGTWLFLPPDGFDVSAITSLMTDEERERPSRTRLAEQGRGMLASEEKKADADAARDGGSREWFDLKKGKRTNRYVQRRLRGTKGIAVVNDSYYGMFKKLFPSCTFHVNSRDPSRAVVVKQGGRAVGLLMPLNAPEDGWPDT